MEINNKVSYNLNRQTIQMKPKKFIIRKFVMAKSASDAIAKDKTTPVYDVVVDEDWARENDRQELSFGFTAKRGKK